MSSEHCFLLPDISCEGCVKHIKDTLSAHQERLAIEAFDVQLAGKKLKIRMANDEHSDEELFKSIYLILNDIGFTCVQEKPVRNWSWFFGIVGTGTGAALSVIMMFMPALPLTAMIIIASISVPLTLVLGAKAFERSIKLARKGILNMDTLFAISTLTILVVSITSFFVPWLPMMFDSGLLIFGFRHLGIVLNEAISKNMKPELTFRDSLPTTVDVLKDSQTCQLSLSNVAINDTLLIYPGAVIPVDGICDVETIIMETTFTGSTEPRRVFPGEHLLAGMVVAQHGQVLKLRASSTTEESTLAKLDQSIFRASQEKAPLETMTDKILVYFIIGIIAVSIFSGILVGYFFSPALAIQCAVAVLVSACPCTLGLITPLALRIGMRKAEKNGTHFKSPKNLEEASTIDTVFFDLNGTLTANAPKVRAFRVLSDQINTDDFFNYARSLESAVAHPTANAICSYIGQQQPQPSDVEWNIEFSTHHFHSGVAAMINGVDYFIGNQEMMEQVGIDVQNIEQPLDKKKEIMPGDTIIYLARAKEIVGYFIINDPLRTDASFVVQSLISQGKKVVICSGANKSTVKRYAEALGIVDDDCILAGRAPTPETRRYLNQPDKQTDIVAFQNKGCHVAMIGDAGNDAVAVTKSQFGIAIQSRSVDQPKQGNDVTQCNAGAVINDKSLLPVLTAFTVAEQTFTNIKQNLLFSLFYNVGSMVLASGLLLTLGVALNPSVGVALMIVQSVLILLNAVRFKHQELSHLNTVHTEDEQQIDHSYRVVNQKIANQNNAQPDTLLEDNKSAAPTTSSKLFVPNSTRGSEIDDYEMIRSGLQPSS